MKNCTPIFSATVAVANTYLLKKIVNTCRQMWVAFLLAIVSVGAGFAQPTVFFTNITSTVSPALSNSRILLTDIGAFRQARFQPTATVAPATTTYAFHTGTTASPNYSPNWRPYTTPDATGVAYAFNTIVVPATVPNSARNNAIGGGVDGNLAALTANRYYTANITENAIIDNLSAIWETTFSPVTLSAIARTPAAVNQGNPAIINITASVAPNAAEFVYVRYTTNNFTTSTLVQASFSGTAGTAVIPPQTAGTVVSYYVLSSNQTIAQINAAISNASIGQAAYDLVTLNLNNNAGANFTYTVGAAVADPVTVTATSGVTIATYTTLAAAITVINDGTLHSGTINCLVNSGYTETAPAGGYSITATGTMANPITFIKNGAGANPILTAFTPQAVSILTDAIFKIIGGDFITIDGFTMQENAGNTINATGASNNMTEWGVALLYATLTNGSQNNTIQNCTISLNRTYLNTFGIYSNTRHSATAVATSAEVTAATGANSGNRVYANAISNVNYGIVFIGAGSTIAAIDNGNDIGGSSAATGNTITNWGGGAALSGYLSLTGSNYCIFNNQQINDNVSFNTITSAALAQSVTTGGILKNYSVASPTSGTITTTINNNTVTVTNNPTVANIGPIIGINNQGLTPLLATATMSMNNNTVQNCVLGGSTSTTNGLTCMTNLSLPGTMNITGNSIINNAITATTATSGTLLGIGNTGAAGTVNINSNILRSMSSTATSGQMQGINSNGAVVTALNINNNQLGNATSGYFSTSIATSGTLFGIVTSVAASTCAVTIQSNDIRGITYNVTASAAQAYIQNGATSLSQNISSNTFTNLTVNTTGNVTFITNNVVAPAAGFKQVNGNSIVTGFSKTGAGGTVGLYSDGGSSVCTTPVQNMNNNFSNITLTGATTMAGWSNVDGTGSTPQKTITGNIFSNWTCGTGNVNVLQSSFGGSTSISNNTISNITGQGNITGFLQGSSGTIALLTIANNIITGIASTGTGGAVTGISNASPATTTNINNNTLNIYSSTNTTATVVGIATSTSANIFNNTINGLSCVGTTSGVVNGIGVTGGTAHSISKNTIYDLHTSGAFATTPGVNGIVFSGSVSGVTATVSNNRIGDLRATNASSTDAIRGISITATGTTSTYSVYYNTVYLNASSTGTNFGTTGIYHAANITATTSALNLRNNVVVNNSTAAGTGLTVAYRRSIGTVNALNNYASTSNNNLLYAGAPSAANLIYSDGNSTAQTIVAYRTGVFTAGTIAPRDAASISENPPFLSTIGGNANFLKINTTIATGIESGAVNITGITDDFENDIRQGNAGYAGTGTAPDMGADELNGTPLAQCMGTPATATINAVASAVCTGLGTTLSLNTTYTDLGITYQWASSTVSGGPYITLLGTAITQATGNLTATTYYVCTITCTASGMSTTTVQRTITVNPLPTVTINASAPTYCTPGGTAVTLMASGASTYAWSPTTGLNMATGASVMATPLATTMYTVTGTDGNGCVGTSAATTITVAQGLSSLSATATPATICAGSSSQLLATATTTATYTVAAATFNMLTATGVETTVFSTVDDANASVPLPFNVSFFGNAYNVGYVHTNGFLSFTAAQPVDAYGATIPTAATPNNLITMVWDDLNVTGGGLVKYFTNGTAPNRVFVIEYNAVKFYNFATNNGNLTGQIQIFEADQHIEIHVSNLVDPSPSNHYIGIENAAGTVGYGATGRNPFTTNITTAEAWSFVPNGTGAVTYLWSPSGNLNNAAIANPMASPTVAGANPYTVTATLNGCPTTAMTTVTVNPTSVGGSASENQIICTGSTPTAINLNGHTGTVVRWESSTDMAFTTPTTIANTTTTLPAVQISNTTSLYYRAVVMSGICASANSAPVLVTISPLSVGGTTNANQTICTGSTPTAITLSGHTGNVVRWESSVDMAFSSPTTIANTTTILTASEISNTATLYYRAVVQSGTCASANATSVLVTVTPASVGGMAMANQILAANATPADLTLSGHTGNIVRWERSTDLAFTSPITIANTTTTLTGVQIGPLTATTYFRAVVQNGSCMAANSTVVTIAVGAVACAPGTWLGTVSTDWNTPANWCGGIPNGTTNVVIPAGTPFSPIIMSEDALALTVTINPMTTLTMQGNFNLSISNNGTFTVDGTFIPSAAMGKVIFLGDASIVNYNGVTFKELDIMGTVTTAGNMVVNGNLNLVSGMLDFGGGDLTLNGDIINGMGSLATSQGRLFIGGSGAMTGLITFFNSSLNTLAAFTINRSMGGRAYLGSDVNIGPNSDANINLINGILATNGYLMVFNLPISVNGGSAASYIATCNTMGVPSTVGGLYITSVGPVAMGGFGPGIFNVGPSFTNYNPLTITNAGTPDDYRVLVNNSNISCTTGPDALVTWDITESLAGGSNATLQFTFNASQLETGFDKTKVYIAHQTSTGPCMATLGSLFNVSSQNPGPYTVIESGYSSFSPFSINSPGIILPLSDLLSFDAKKQSSTTANALWTVTANNQLAVFVVEKSLDGRTFSSIGTVNAVAGQTAYQLPDAKLSGGTSYYRLKVTERNGQVFYSKVVAIVNKLSGVELISLQPTLVTNGSTLLQVAAAKAGKMEVMITDQIGRVISRNSYSIAQGNSSIQLNVLLLAGGVYNVTGITAEGKTQSLRFVKE